jgi:hypothetical protein
MDHDKSITRGLLAFPDEMDSETRESTDLPNSFDQAAQYREKRASQWHLTASYIINFVLFTALATLLFKERGLPAKDPSFLVWCT